MSVILIYISLILILIYSSDSKKNQLNVGLCERTDEFQGVQCLIEKHLETKQWLVIIVTQKLLLSAFHLGISGAKMIKTIGRNILS